MVYLRPAEQKDASFLVPLIAESSGGVLPGIWKALANTDESVGDSGKRYLIDSNNDLSIKNTIMVELNGDRVGAMVSYQEDEIASIEPDSRDHTPLPVALSDALQPFRELSDPDSLFISEICFLPEARGQGLGTRLLAYAKNSAIEKGLPRVTLRVFSVNEGAVRLYERSGFQVVDKRQILPHPDIRFAGYVYLMSSTV